MSDDLSHDPSLIQEYLVESEEFLQRMDQVALERLQVSSTVERDKGGLVKTHLSP